MARAPISLSVAGTLPVSPVVAPVRKATKRGKQRNGSSKRQQGQIYVCDVTLPCSDERYPNWKKVAQMLNGVAKKWVFQHEKGEETGYLHWQIRLSLHKRIYAKNLGPTMGPKYGGKWLPTSTNAVGDEGKVSAKTFNYQMKDTTRVSGPWKDTDYVEPPPLTWQLRRFMELTDNGKNLYGYQKVVRDDIVGKPEMRLIDNFCDFGVGNLGKSAFVEWLMYTYDRVYELPSTLQTAEDFMQYCHNLPMSNDEPATLIFDMPLVKAGGMEKAAQLYAAIECLKNGMTYDKRYAGRYRRFCRPRIIIFCNSPPNYECLIKDRWRNYRINPDHSCTEISCETSTAIQRRIDLHKKFEKMKRKAEEKRMFAEYCEQQKDGGSSAGTSTGQGGFWD